MKGEEEKKVKSSTNYSPERPAGIQHTHTHTHTHTGSNIHVQPPDGPTHHTCTTLCMYINTHTQSHKEASFNSFRQKTRLHWFILIHWPEQYLCARAHTHTHTHTRTHTHSHTRLYRNLNRWYLQPFQAEIFTVDVKIKAFACMALSSDQAVNLVWDQVVMCSLLQTVTTADQLYGDIWCFSGCFCFKSSLSCFSCSAERCNSVLLWSSRTVLWTQCLFLG